MIPFVGHAGVALIIAFLLRIDPLLTVIGSFIPDIDFVTSLLKVKWSKGHRRLTHSLLFITLFIVLSLVSPFFIPLAVGLATHYATDLDSWGIPLFYPFNNKYYSIKKINHGKSFENPQAYIKEFFRKRGLMFWIEWALLALGIILNWGYIAALVKTMLGF